MQATGLFVWVPACVLSSALVEGFLTIHLQRWVSSVGEHNSLPLGTLIKYPFSSHPKTSSETVLHHFYGFFPLHRHLTPGFLKYSVLYLSEESGIEEIIFAGFHLFSQNAWLLLTVIVFHSFIPLVGFLCLRIVFKPTSLIFWCADLLPSHLASAGIVSAQHYWKLASKCI